ncbi:isoprenylcysteine carboxylmethyltransferase family protein [Photobacterium leiognathi subsp. mandapamensis]|uniref:methyltransferase family protein n=1 Tax=Photobacterium leiognathi TaxID=553611 RepID=UPI000D16A57D|nr:isoprenylcysteine carboxylmethyltransferase family protein [Photobacterium leiognathi]PSW66771.1 isoprenylcysteine carboxylmethyltransferase family protein [Photobacterium leiognathi subsp. mandapamensis]
MSLRVPPPILLLLSILGMYLLSRFYPVMTFDFDGKSLLISMLCFIGVIPGFTAIIAFAKANTTIDPRYPKKTSRLVTTGIYRFTRNPMYLGLVLFLFAAAFYFSALSCFVVVPVFIWVMNNFQIEPEEAVLLAMFGEDYQHYCQTVRRWC